jgi:putative flippase GtrA
VKRLDHVVREFGKFSFLMLSVYVLEVLLFNIALGPLEFSPVASKAFSYLICAVITFYGNKMWTWRDRAPAGLLREYLVYSVVTLIGLAVLLSFVSVSHYVLGSFLPFFRTPWADNVSANLVGPPLVAVFRFWAYRRFVFTTPVPAT